MGALDIICIDFQLGPRIGLGQARQQQAVGTLHSIGFVGTRRHKNAATKYAARRIVENTPIVFAADTCRLAVANDGLMINMAAPVDVVKAIQKQLAVHATKISRDIMPRQLRAK